MTQACVPPSSGPVTYSDGPGRAVPAELVFYRRAVGTLTLVHGRLPLQRQDPVAVRPGHPPPNKVDTVPGPPGDPAACPERQPVICRFN